MDNSIFTPTASLELPVSHMSLGEKTHTGTGRKHKLNTGLNPELCVKATPLSQHVTLLVLRQGEFPLAGNHCFLNDVKVHSVKPLKQETASFQV